MNVYSPSWFVLSQAEPASLEGVALVPASVFTSFALIIVVLRWYSKIRLAPGTQHIEDFVITAALVRSQRDPEVSN